MRFVLSSLVDLDNVPHAGVVVRFDLQDEPKRRFWMLLQRPVRSCARRTRDGPKT